MEEDDIHVEKWMADQKIDELVIGHDIDGFVFLSNALSAYALKKASEFAVWTQTESWNYSPFYGEWLHRGEYAPKTTEELYKIFLDSRE